MIKYTSNVLLATMISLSNEIANLSAEIGGIDVPAVMDGVHLSRYLTSESGETAQLASFLYPGCGYGGSCLPKDTKALVSQGSDLGVPMRVLEAVDLVNASNPRRCCDILRRHFPKLVGLRVGVLGLAFRPGTDDMRESPAIPIVHELLRDGAEVRAYDPIALESATDRVRRIQRKALREMAEVVEDVDAVLLVTRWREFEGVPDLIAQQGGATTTDRRSPNDQAQQRAKLRRHRYMT